MNRRIFYRNILASILFLGVLVSFNGCAYLVVGGVGALGGYVVSPDTVEGITDADETAVWDAALEVLSVMGIIEEQNETGGMIIAKIQKTKVNVTIQTINPKTTKLTIKARRAFIPKIQIAQDVFVKIMSSTN